MDLASILYWAFIIIGGLSLFFGVWFTVEQQTVRFVERFGKFRKIGEPGLNFKVPFIDSVSSGFDMKLQQLVVEVQTKTEDNVFVGIDVAVQYEVMPEKAYEAHYRLQDPATQIKSYVFDVVRAQVPKLKLDDVFLSKDEIAGEVNTQLQAAMTQFGYSIEKTLVTDVKPDESVQSAMNEINAAQRLQVAAQSKGEANKVIIVKAAEADAEAKALAGKGVADERLAIVAGLRESIKETSEAIGVDPSEVMTLVMMTQYFDTLREIGKQGTTIMLPGSPEGVGVIANEIRKAIISGKKA